MARKAGGLEARNARPGTRIAAAPIAGRVLSALFVNDVICLVLAPPILITLFVGWLLLILAPA